MHLRMEIRLCEKHHEQHQFLICKSAQDVLAISPKPSVPTLSWQGSALRNKQGSCYYWFPRLDRSAWGLKSSVIYSCDHEAMWLDASLISEILIDLPPSPVRTTLYHSKSLAFIFMWKRHKQWNKGWIGIHRPRQSPAPIGPKLNREGRSVENRTGKIN